jgi:hypothetical protein
METGWTRTAPTSPGWYLIKEHRKFGNRYTAVKIVRKNGKLFITTESYYPLQPFEPVNNGDEWLFLEKTSWIHRIHQKFRTRVLRAHFGWKRGE